MAKKEYIEAGRIINTHAIKGEVKIEVWLDSAKFLKSFRRYRIGAEEYRVVSARVHKDFLIAKLEGIDDVNSAMALRGSVISVMREDASLPEGTFFIQDIIGASVIDQNGAELGKLTEVIDSPASMVYVVSGETEHLIPAVPEFIMSTDPDAGIIKVKLIEGM